MRETFYNIEENRIIEPLTVALIADLNGKPYPKVIDSFDKNHPDIIAIAGDVIKEDDDPYPISFFENCACIA